MAGVKCEHCGELMEGKVRNREVISCITCKKAFRVTKELMLAYENEREKSFKDYAKKFLMIPVYVIGFLVVFSLGMIAYVNLGGGTSSSMTARQSQTAPEDFFSGWDGSNRELVNAVKAGMHDPDSFEHVETRYKDNGDSFGILMTFRGTNGFGAVVTQQVTADINKQTRTISNLQQVK